MKLENKKGDLHFFALGGLNEVGKNTYIVEHEGEIVIIDAGLKLSESAASGIDAIIPEYKYLVENKDRIVGLIVTHGHEDHIGGIPYLLQELELKKIWAPRIAKSLIEKKFDDKHVKFKGDLIEFERDFVLKTKKLTFKAFEVNHSIPDSYGFIIESSTGVRIVHTADFKFDFNPLGRDCELDKISQAGKDGVDLLISDSTGSMSEGWTSSESVVSKTVDSIFHKAKGRVMIAAFASNIYRVKQIVETAHKHNKKIICFGRSMVKVIKIAQDIKLMDVPASTFIDKTELKSIDDNRLVILMTGSQGETLAALSRIANGEHQQIAINKNDTIVLSSSPIPGNRVSVSLLINKLYKKGATVFDNAMISTLHTSGHASKEEQRLMMKITTPKHFLPVHGEYAMMKMHNTTAIESGVPKDNCYLMDNGDVLTISSDKKFRVQRQAVPASTMYIDGKDQESTNPAIIRDRVEMGEEGVVAVYITINSKENKLEQNPAILSRGCFYTDTSKDIVYKIKTVARISAQEVLKSKKPTFLDLKKKVKASVSSAVWKLLKKKPLIIPIIINTYTFPKKELKKPEVS